MITLRNTVKLTQEHRAIFQIILPDESYYKVGTGDVTEIYPFEDGGSIWFLIYKYDNLDPSYRVESSGVTVVFF